jgi:hypothetical protein
MRNFIGVKKITQQEFDKLGSDKANKAKRSLRTMLAPKESTESVQSQPGNNEDDNAE